MVVPDAARLQQAAVALAQESARTGPPTLLAKWRYGAASLTPRGAGPGGDSCRSAGQLRSPRRFRETVFTIPTFGKSRAGAHTRIPRRSSCSRRGFKIRQLTDVSPCKLQHYLLCNRSANFSACSDLPREQTRRVTNALRDQLEPVH
jgi:hypothetical protein